MKEDNYSSPTLIKDMEEIFGGQAKIIKIKMKSDKEMKKYLRVTEEAYKKAATSKLHFD